MYQSTAFAQREKIFFSNASAKIDYSRKPPKFLSEKIKDLTSVRLVALVFSG
jgi:hypothetical protein